MKALVYTEPYTFKYTDVDDPKPANDEVLIRVKYCGICGSDVHGYTGSTGRRVPPMIMGHEISGDIAEVGNEVEGFNSGDRVSFEPPIFCGHCLYCLSGQGNICENRKVVGVSVDEWKVDGGMAEFLTVPSHVVHKLPDSLSYEEATQLDATSVAVHAVNRSDISLNDTVVIVGTGTIGLLALQAAKAKGAGVVVVTDVNDSRLEFAKKLGADLAFNPTKVNLVEEIKEITYGVGADVAIEAVGFEATFNQAMAVTKTGGQMTVIGNSQRMAQTNIQEIVVRELTIRGNYASKSGEFAACLDLIASGTIKIEPLINQILPLQEAPQAFEELDSGKSTKIKVLLEP